MPQSFTQRHFGSPASHLRSITFLEGLSYLVLLFIAMPLKYLGDMPLAVRISGSVHGGLFIWFCILVAAGLRVRKRPVKWGLRLLVASLVPFGTIAIDQRLRAEVVSDEKHR